MENITTVDGVAVTRYITRWYCTTQPAEAERLSAIDGTKPDQVRTTEGVILLHATDRWAYWSDGRVTTSIGLSPTEKTASVQSLSATAADLISGVRGADGGEVEGGWPTLVKIARELSRTTIEKGPDRGVYHRATVEKIEVENNDGTKATLYEYSAGYFEGYAYGLFLSVDSLEKWVRM